jgi:hypothetical protein
MYYDLGLQKVETAPSVVQHQVFAQSPMCRTAIRSQSFLFPLPARIRYLDPVMPMHPPIPPDPHPGSFLPLAAALNGTAKHPTLVSHSTLSPAARRN